MKNKIPSLLAAGLMMTTGLLQAAPTVVVYEYAVQAGKASEFAAALDTLQKSIVARDRTAQLHLESVGFNGVSTTATRCNLSATVTSSKSSIWLSVTHLARTSAAISH